MKTVNLWMSHEEDGIAALFKNSKETWYAWRIGGDSRISSREPALPNLRGGVDFPIYESEEL